VDKFAKTFAILEKYYKPIPLEVFGKNPYKTLISTLLSSRTLDTTTHKASLRLFEKAPDIRHLGSLEINDISKLIYPVGFYKTKAKQLKKLARMIISEFKGRIPGNLEALVSLPGVGIKTANLCLNRAFGKPAIAVDTHVHKITNILGWVHTRSPEETEKALEKILPKKYWSQTNRVLVSIGQRFRGKRLLEFLKNQKLIT
jgi:endonuclease III